MSLIKEMTSIRTLLAEIPKRTSSDFSDTQILSVVIPLIYTDLYVVLCALELTLEEACQRAGRQRTQELVRDFIEAEHTAGYWSEGPISVGVIDHAVRCGILNIDEKAVLLKLIQYSRLPLERVTLSTIEELEEGVGHVESIFRRCGTHESTAKPSLNPSVSEPSVLTAEFVSPIDDDGVRRDFEVKFQGSLERKIDGTLGTIFVFKRPPNTYPERVAVKTVNPKLVKAESGNTRQTVAIESLIHEVRQWIEYRHSPLILHPFFIELVRGWPYIVMPYCERTLRHYIDEASRKASQSEAIALTRQGGSEHRGACR